MASMALNSPSSNHFVNDGYTSFSRVRLCSFSFESSLYGFKIPRRQLSLSVNETRTTRPKPACYSGSEPLKASSQSFDVVIVGAGIIGLTIARQFLIGSDLSVAVVDKAVPCSGATGAGSLLVGRTPGDSIILRERVRQLSEAGLTAEYLPSNELLSVEPALFVGSDGGAAFVPDDCQLDALRTVSYIEKVNRSFTLEGRYAEFYHEPVAGLVRSTSSGEVEAVQTSNNTLYGKAIVVAAGCWSQSLMHDLFRGSNVKLDVLVKPRKGHLLVLENFNSLQLNHGLMEVGYVDYENSILTPGLNDQSQTLSVSMTATMDTMGNLILGSSRQFAGF
ncbi:FAD-dependent oxidoreductase family protein isoform 3, partial [Theobroma cacao]